MTVAPLSRFTARGVKRRFRFLCPLLRFGRFRLSRPTGCAGNVDFVAGDDSVRRIRDHAIIGGDGAFRHGQTYSAHALCCAAALAVQDVVDNENLLARVATSGHYLHGRLAERFADHVATGDIRGRGLLQAIEFVADRTTKRPFPAQLGLAARIKAEAFSRGLLVYPGPAAADGTTGDHVLLAPPYIATDAELDSVVDLLGAAVDAALASVRALAA